MFVGGKGLFLLQSVRLKFANFSGTWKLFSSALIACNLFPAVTAEVKLLIIWLFKFQDFKLFDINQVTYFTKCNGS